MHWYMLNSIIFALGNWRFSGITTGLFPSEIVYCIFLVPIQTSEISLSSTVIKGPIIYFNIFNGQNFIPLIAHS